jgi:hypothetical protein
VNEIMSSILTTKKKKKKKEDAELMECCEDLLRGLS